MTWTNTVVLAWRLCWQQPGLAVGREGSEKALPLCKAAKWGCQTGYRLGEEAVAARVHQLLVLIIVFTLKGVDLFGGSLLVWTLLLWELWCTEIFWYLVLLEQTLLVKICIPGFWLEPGEGCHRAAITEL